MAYARYATSDTIYALNDDTWQVEILQDGAQSQNHKFEVGPAGVQLIYESPEDDILVPGIVHSRCEVETIWPPDVYFGYYTNSFSFSFTKHYLTIYFNTFWAYFKSKNNPRLITCP